MAAEVSLAIFQIKRPGPCDRSGTGRRL